MTHNRRSFLKSIGTATAGAAVSTVLPGTVRNAVAQDKIVWKAVTNHRIGAIWSVRWQWLQEEIQKRTDGRLSLQVSILPELGLSGTELLRVLRSNLVDFADVTTGYVAGDLPAVEAAQLPGVYTDSTQIRKALDVWTPKIIAPREDIMGGKIVGSFNFNNVYLFSKFAVNALEDIKGKKIRVFSVALADFVGGLGGEPVNMPVSELYSALQRGAIDGAITGPDQVEGAKLYEVCGFISDLRLGASPAYSVVSRKSWDRLPDNLKKVFDDMAAPLTTKGWEAGEVNNKTGLELAAAKGMKVIVPAKPEWNAALTKVASEVVAPRWSKRVGPQTTQAFNDNLSSIVGVKI